MNYKLSKKKKKKKKKDALINLRQAIHRFSEIGLKSLSEEIKKATDKCNEISKKLYETWFKNNYR